MGSGAGTRGGDGLRSESLISRRPWFSVNGLRLCDEQSISWRRTMSTNPEKVSPLKPYAEVRTIFSEARRVQLETQGPVTQAVIRKIQQSRKCAKSQYVSS